ncbi:MAG: HAD-IIB family hydrolase [Polyangiaceae bacterium]|nr:HAD-IIB family hydrolase [Polyangiaceae bacterium]
MMGGRDSALAPLSTLPIDEARRVRGLLFEVDDTVTRNGRLEASALDALYRLGQTGIKRVAVTGRPLGWAEAIAHQWPVDLAIGENGAGYVRVTEDGVCTGYFSSAAERSSAAVELARIRAMAAREVPEISLSADHASRRCDIAFDIGEHARPTESAIARLVALIEDAGLRWLRSSVHLHVMAGGWDKASGALLAIEQGLGDAPDPSVWAFIGDSGNDAAAFARFPFSVGVSNVREHIDRLSVPPRFVTRGDRGLGFAELADSLIAAWTDGFARGKHLA